jgi:hypothetical protein
MRGKGRGGGGGPGAAPPREASAEEFDDPQARQARIDALRRALSERAQRSVDELLALYGFREGDAAEAPLPQVDGRWAMDLFNPEALRLAGARLGKGAVVGAAIGVAADLAVGGISLGAGAALGGAIGGALAQGWGPLGRKLANKLRGVHELTVEDSVLFVLADWQLNLLRALEQRGHAAQQRIEGAAADHATPGHAARSQALARIVQGAQPARSHPEWEQDGRHGNSAERRALVGTVAQYIQRAAEERAARD